MPAHYFFGGIDLDALRARIPTHHIAVGVEHEDGVLWDIVDETLEFDGIACQRFNFSQPPFNSGHIFPPRNLTESSVEGFRERHKCRGAWVLRSNSFGW